MPAGASAAATASAVTTAIRNRRIADGKADCLARQGIDHLLRVLLVTFEDDERVLKQRFHLWVLDLRDECLLDEFVRGVVIAQLIARIVLVEGAPAELAQLVDDCI